MKKTKKAQNQLNRLSLISIIDIKKPHWCCNKWTCEADIFNGPKLRNNTIEGHRQYSYVINIIYQQIKQYMKNDPILKQYWIVTKKSK